MILSYKVYFFILLLATMSQRGDVTQVVIEWEERALGRWEEKNLFIRNYINLMSTKK